MARADSPDSFESFSSLLALLEHQEHTRRARAPRSPMPLRSTLALGFCCALAAASDAPPVPVYVLTEAL